ncbi:MAG: hypothetical protein KAI84_21730, partial [Gammaproteobacteria bacterium]|nr:hypothetical protein [Gammaproteobacteria bacterium]
EMNSSVLSSIKITYIGDYIVCRNIIMPDKKTQFILAVLSNSPESSEIEAYYDQLLDWAVDNATPDLEKLSSI